MKAPCYCFLFLFVLVHFAPLTCRSSEFSFEPKALASGPEVVSALPEASAYGSLLSAASAVGSFSSSLPFPAQDDGLSQEEISRAVEDVMEHEDFRSVRRDRKGMIEQFFDWLDESMRSAEDGRTVQSGNAPGAGVSALLQLFLYGMLAVIIVVVIIAIAIIIRSWDKGKKPDLKSLDLPVSLDQATGLSTPPGEQAVSIYEQRAQKYAAEGNYRAAIRELLLGSMSWIERSGLIRFRKGLTNRDYIRVIWRREPHRQSYFTIATYFELVYFGRRTASQEMYQACLNGFQGAFRETETRQTNPTV